MANWKLQHILVEGNKHAGFCLLFGPDRRCDIACPAEGAKAGKPCSAQIEGKIYYLGTFIADLAYILAKFRLDLQSYYMQR